MSNATQLNKIDLKVTGMTCGGCERSVQNALLSQPGVVDATADRMNGIVSVQFDPSVIGRQAVEKAITDAGYPVAA